MIAVLIGRDGREVERLVIDREAMHAQAWISHRGKVWGFGTAKVAGECFYYEVTMPATDPAPAPLPECLPWGNRALPPNLADDQSVMSLRVKRGPGRWDS